MHWNSLKSALMQLKFTDYDCDPKDVSRTLFVLRNEH